MTGPFVILDRDGVINVDSDNFIRNADAWQPLPGAIEAIGELASRGYDLAVASNQSGIGRGLIRQADLNAMHRKMFALCATVEGCISVVRFCPHTPEAGCRCRKPAPGMLLDLMRKFSVTPAQTLFVGDASRDILAARNAGCLAVLVRSSGASSTPHEDQDMAVPVVRDLMALIDLLPVAPAQR